MQLAILLILVAILSSLSPAKDDWQSRRSGPAPKPRPLPDERLLTGKPRRNLQTLYVAFPVFVVILVLIGNLAEKYFA